MNNSIYSAKCDGRAGPCGRAAIENKARRPATVLQKLKINPHWNKYIFLLPLCLAALSARAEENLRPLKLEFPPPMLTGTPVPAKLGNLEAPNVKPPTILVPAGVTNLAKGKKITSSDPAPVIGDLTLITDGEKESEEGYFVELDRGLQWVQIDLGTSAELYAIAVWHYHSQVRAYLQMSVQVSDDPEFKKDVHILYNNDEQNKAGFGTGTSPAYLEKNTGRVIPANKTAARYVRLYSAGNTANELNHYIEVEVFGRPRP